MPTMNWMQKEAMLVMLRREQASLKDLRPRDVQANLFAYHFDELIHKGYVEKVGRGRYGLTPLGHRFANTISADSGAVVEEIKTVIMLYGKVGDEYLLFRRSRQPHIDKIGLIHDRMHRDWSLAEALSNALSEKLGSDKIKTHYVRPVLVKILHEEIIVSHLHALVYEVDLSDLPTHLPFRSKNGTAFMSRLNNLHDGDMLEGLDELLKVIEYHRPDRMDEVFLRY